MMMLFANWKLVSNKLKTDCYSTWIFNGKKNTSPSCTFCKEDTEIIESYLGPVTSIFILFFWETIYFDQKDFSLV